MDSLDRLPGMGKAIGLEGPEGLKENKLDPLLAAGANSVTGVAKGLDGSSTVAELFDGFDPLAKGSLAGADELPKELGEVDVFLGDLDGFEPLDPDPEEKLNNGAELGGTGAWFCVENLKGNCPVEACSCFRGDASSTRSSTSVKGFEVISSVVGVRLEVVMV